MPDFEDPNASYQYPDAGIPETLHYLPDPEANYQYPKAGMLEAPQYIPDPSGISNFDELDCPSERVNVPATLDAVSNLAPADQYRNFLNGNRGQIALQSSQNGTYGSREQDVLTNSLCTDDSFTLSARLIINDRYWARRTK